MMGGTPAGNTERLRGLAFREGAVLFGIADIGPIRNRFLLSAEETAGMTCGISMAVALSSPVLMGIVDHPTLLYKWHYQQANNLLDKMAFRLYAEIAAAGHRALPIPASQIVDWSGHKGHVSHRAVAELAGLGWRGRNNLVVNGTHGSAIRLVTLLTDMPLIPDSPVSTGCGSCMACVKLCPAGALGTEAGEYRLDLCHAKLTEFSKERGIGVHICGVCVKACLFRPKSGDAG
jgi:epoxyqueuosine reductase